MQVSKDMCGFSGGQADTLRKAIGKKQRDTMAKMKAAFVEGMMEHSKVDRQFAEKFWARMEAFADYGFNKVHSTPYAMIAYQTAYLKANYPAAYMAALMTSDYDDKDRLAIEITECTHMGITVLPPDINESFIEFAVVPQTEQIRFGMAAVKNVGTGVVEEILRARQEGTFATLVDFLTRVSNRIVGRKAMESLIKAGAFDRFGDRATLLHNLDLLLAFASRLQKQANSGQTDIFGNSEGGVTSELPRLELQAPPPQSDHHHREQLLWERELLGLYLSQHPLELFETILSEKTIALNTLTVEHDGKAVTIGGAITDVREITTKNGQKMAFIKVEDRFAEVEVVVFPSSYQQTAGLWQRDRVVLIRGKVNVRDQSGQQGNEVKVMVDDAREITSEQASAYQATGKQAKTPKPKKASVGNQAPAPSSLQSYGESRSVPGAPGADTKAILKEAAPARIYIRLANTSDEQILLSLKETLDTHRGDTEVVLVLGEATTKQAIKLPGGLDSSSEGITKLQALVGSENLVLK